MAFCWLKAQLPHALDKKETGWEQELSKTTMAASFPEDMRNITNSKWIHSQREVQKNHCLPKPVCPEMGTSTLQYYSGDSMISWKGTEIKHGVLTSSLAKLGELV